MELLLVILLYGLFWGAYQFWGYNKTVNKVLSNPEKYSPRKVNFSKKLTFLPKALFSFLIALAGGIGAIILAWIVLSIISLFQ